MPRVWYGKVYMKFNSVHILIRTHHLTLIRSVSKLCLNK
jgi:hypothetical protein